MKACAIIGGTRLALIWLVICAVLALVVGSGACSTTTPQDQERQAAQAALEQIEIHYQAGMTFQSVGDWEKAVREYEKVILVKSDYQEVRARFAEVKGKQAEAHAQATDAAVARAAEAAAEAWATSTAEADDPISSVEPHARSCEPR